MDIWQQLYACLSINHNFNTSVKIDDIIWKGWIQALQPHEHLMPELIDAINGGKLADHLNIKRKVKIDLQDVKTLLKSLLRNSNLDKTYNTMQIEHRQQMSKQQLRAMLDKVKSDAKERVESGESLSTVTKQRYPDMPINKYFKD